SAARPPEVKGEEYGFDNRSDGHAQTQEQERPHVGGGESNDKAGEDGPQRNRHLVPYSMWAPLHCQRHSSLLRLPNALLSNTRSGRTRAGRARAQHTLATAKVCCALALPPRGIDQPRQKDGEASRRPVRLHRPDLVGPPREVLPVTAGHVQALPASRRSGAA